MNNLIPLVVHHSFDPEVDVYLFESEEAAIEELKTQIDEEIRIETEENDHEIGEDLEIDRSENGTWASITIYYDEEKDVTEWAIGTVKEPAKREPKFVAYDISWEIDMDEVYAKLDEMTIAGAAKAIEVPFQAYASMTTEERHDYAYDYFRRREAAKAEFMGLPETVDIPNEFHIKDENEDMDDVTEWLSDEYGYFISGYRVKRKVA